MKRQGQSPAPRAPPSGPKRSVLGRGRYRSPGGGGRGRGATRRRGRPSAEGDRLDTAGRGGPPGEDGHPDDVAEGAPRKGVDDGEAGRVVGLERPLRLLGE